MNFERGIVCVTRSAQLVLTHHLNVTISSSSSSVAPVLSKLRFLVDAYHGIFHTCVSC